MDRVAVKAVLWVGSSREDMRAFAKDARQRAGYELYRVQRGLDPSDRKPMPVVGPGVREIRVHTRLEHRVIYIAKFEEGLYVLHAFEKRNPPDRRDGYRPGAVAVEGRAGHATEGATRKPKE